jgi:drug/metabolite transporter (DMT)-like permease
MVSRSKGKDCVKSIQLASVMIVGSGAAHAVVSAILKSGRDKMSSRALIDGFSAALVLPIAFFVPFPTGAWHWLLLSGVVHLVYLVCLIKSFENADMSVAYPIARGAAPALAAAGAVTLFAEPITAAVIGGIALVSAGVISIGLGHRVDRRAIGWAAATALCIAIYTVIDAQGVRASPSAASYIVWIFLMLGGGVGVAFAIWRGPRFMIAARSEWRAGLAAGAMSIVTYGLALWAYRLGDTPRLAALRETSIVFAALIAVFFLRERMTAVRVVGTGLIAAGAALLLAMS